MNKIIIDPHYCSREEYQELKDYLTRKTWDWQEVSSGINEQEIKEELNALYDYVCADETMQCGQLSMSLCWDRIKELEDLLKDIE